ncbi:hypothetical protein PHAMO_210304 [Magnetospirillum molischianum DSM 120]|uniref:Uncharacterized protein n=1 Tax=Magnetospirillum molischianum DSM 120 TaxID=1150626 RepID=H8FR05_MAGML|nr:hypothetical protein PHAMO_210304 [Magnetospirillum molischianum DSM 120]
MLAAPDENIALYQVYVLARGLRGIAVLFIGSVPNRPMIPPFLSRTEVPLLNGRVILVHVWAGCVGGRGEGMP